MKGIYLRLLRAGLPALAFTLLLSSCLFVGTSGRQHEVYYVDQTHPRASHHVFYYYPSSRVYYNPSSQEYFWYDRDEWHSGHHLPDYITIRESDREVFESDADRPYEVNERIVREYRPRHHFWFFVW